MQGRKTGNGREKDRRKTRITCEDYGSTPVSEMFDLVWFWPLKLRVRPIVFLNQCCNPPYNCSRERGEKGKSYTGRSVATVKKAEQGKPQVEKQGERGRKRKRSIPDSG